MRVPDTSGNTRKNGPEVSELRLADFVARQLESWGIEHVFGVAGDANLHLLDALGRSPIRYYGARHESCAGFMASAYAKTTGKLGVCTATSGPGVANLINGVADAYKDRVPVLAITGQVQSWFVGTGHKQAINQQSLMSGVAGFSEQAAHPDAVPDLLATAAQTAFSQGTVGHISIPFDFWEAEIQTPVRGPEPYLGTRPISPAGVVARGADIIAGSARPLMLIGRGARRAGEAVMRLAEKINAAVSYTLPANGIVPWDHPLVVGGLGAAGSEASSSLLAGADLVVRIGATWWPKGYVPAVPPAILDINLSPADMDNLASVHYGVVGDAAEVVPVIESACRTRTRNDEWRAAVQAARSEWQARIDTERTAPDSPNVHPADIVRALAKVPAGTILVMDSGDQTIWFNRHYCGNGQQILVPGYWRSLGFAVPAAVAAKMALPERPSVALIGDAGLNMCLSEIAAAVQGNVPIVVIVANNSAMAIEMNRMIKAGLKPAGVECLNPGFAGFAEICGAKGWHITRPEQIEAALAEAMASDRPAVIEIATDPVMVPTTTL